MKTFKRFLFSESSVVLVTADGKEITVPIGRLGANERKRLTTITKQLRSHTRKYENSLAEHLKRGRSDSYGSFAYRALLPDWAARSDYPGEILDYIDLNRPIADIKEATTVDVKEMLFLEKLDSYHRMPLKLLDCKFLGRYEHDWPLEGSSITPSIGHASVSPILFEDATGNRFILVNRSEDMQKQLAGMQSGAKINVLCIASPNFSTKGVWATKKFGTGEHNGVPIPIGKCIKIDQ